MHPHLPTIYNLSWSLHRQQSISLAKFIANNSTTVSQNRGKEILRQSLKTFLSKGILSNTRPLKSITKLCTKPTDIHHKQTMTAVQAYKQKSTSKWHSQLSWMVGLEAPLLETGHRVPSQTGCQLSCLWHLGLKCTPEKRKNTVEKNKNVMISFSPFP